MDILPSDAFKAILKKATKLEKAPREFMTKIEGEDCYEEFVELFERWKTFNIAKVHHSMQPSKTAYDTVLELEDVLDDMRTFRSKLIWTTHLSSYDVLLLELEILANEQENIEFLEK